MFIEIFSDIFFIRHDFHLFRISQENYCIISFLTCALQLRVFLRSNLPLESGSLELPFTPGKYQETKLIAPLLAIMREQENSQLETSRHARSHHLFRKFINVRPTN